MCNTKCCVLMCVGLGLVWFALATYLTTQAWNKVVAHVTGWKTLSWKQVVLFLAALVVLCAPRTFLKYGRGGCDHHGGEGKHCPFPKGGPGGAGGDPHAPPIQP